MSQLTTRQCYLDVALVPTPPDGVFDGPPMWVSSDPTIVSPVSSSDGLTATLNAGVVGVGAIVTITSSGGGVPLIFSFDPIDVVVDPRDIPVPVPATAMSAVLPDATDKP